MTEYRFYFQDGRGHFIRVVELSCDDDEAATREAEIKREGARGELWQGERLVCEFPADQPPSVR